MFNRQSTRHTAAVLATLVALALAAGLMAPQASAFDDTSSYAPGLVQFFGPIQGSHFMAAWGGPFVPMLVHQNVKTCKSPRTIGDQTVTAQYTVYRWTGSGWAATAGNEQQTRISAGYQCAWLPPVTVFTSSSGYFTVAATYVWRDSRGYLLGTTHFRFNGTYESAGVWQDYRCVTSRPCSAPVGAGWIYL
jgi:hypothetical protein